MSDKSPSTELVLAEIEPLIRIVRGQRVMIDFDLAELYELSTASLNQGVERNLDRFPEDFAFQLTKTEFTNLGLGKRAGRGGRRKLPWVFTEHGVAMLSSVLRSPTAVRLNIEIIRTFVRIRRLLAVPGEFVAQLQALAETVKMHDVAIREIDRILAQLLQPPPGPPNPRKIGF